MKPFQTEWVSPTCSVDPITLTGLAIAGIAGFGASQAFSSSSSGAAASTPAATPSEAPAPAASAPATPPSTTRPKPKSNTPSFIGGSAIPENKSFGTKTLLGQ